MKHLRITAASLALLACGCVQAAVITHGSLSRDPANRIIHDSLNNLEWLGWDVTRGLTYAQTVAATQAGGQFEGFTIAGIGHARRFVTALIHPTPLSCIPVPDASLPPGLFCSSSAISPLAEQVTGENGGDHRADFPVPHTHDYDYVLFLSDNGVAADVGMIELHIEDLIPMNHSIALVEEVLSFSEADLRATDQDGDAMDESFGWLLFRQAQARVPEPGTTALLGLGLLGLYGLRRPRR